MICTDIPTSGVQLHCRSTQSRECHCQEQRDWRTPRSFHSHEATVFQKQLFQFGTVLYVAETFAWNSQRSALTAQPDATRQTHAVVKRSFSGIDVSLSMVFELFGKQRWFSQPQPELGRMCGQVRRIWVALWRVICQEGLSLEIALAVYALWNRGRSHHHGIGLTSGLQEAGLMILHRFSRRPFVPSW